MNMCFVLFLMVRNFFIKDFLDIFMRMRLFVRFKICCVRLVMFCIFFSIFSVMFLMWYFIRSVFFLMLNVWMCFRSFFYLVLSFKVLNLFFRFIFFYVFLMGWMRLRVWSCFVIFKIFVMIFLVIIWIFLIELFMIFVGCNFWSFWRVLFNVIKDLLYIIGVCWFRLKLSLIDWFKIFLERFKNLKFFLMVKFMILFGVFCEWLLINVMIVEMLL